MSGYGFEGQMVYRVDDGVTTPLCRLLGDVRRLDHDPDEAELYVTTVDWLYRIDLRTKLVECLSGLGSNAGNPLPRA